MKCRSFYAIPAACPGCTSRIDGIGNLHVGQEKSPLSRGCLHSPATTFDVSRGVFVQFAARNSCVTDRSVGTGGSPVPAARQTPLVVTHCSRGSRLARTFHPTDSSADPRIFLITFSSVGPPCHPWALSIALFSLLICRKSLFHVARAAIFDLRADAERLLLDGAGKNIRWQENMPSHILAL